MILSWDIIDVRGYEAAVPGGNWSAPMYPEILTLLQPLPNNGSGLGNIAYDRENDQLFVTNHHDGMIYRLAMDGTVLQTFDFDGTVTFAGTDTDDFVALGERLWRIAVHDGRVYFSVWNEDEGVSRNSNAVENEIWSIALVGGDVYDPLGKKIKTVTSMTNVEMSIDLRQIPTGIYFIQVKSQTGETLHATKVRVVK